MRSSWPGSILNSFRNALGMTIWNLGDTLTLAEFIEDPTFVVSTVEAYPKCLIDCNGVIRSLSFGGGSYYLTYRNE